MKSLKSKLILITAIMLIAVAASLGIISILTSTKIMQNEISRNIESKAQDAAIMVSRSINTEIKILEQIAGRTRIATPTNDMEDRLKALKEDLERNGYERLAFVDTTGIGYYANGIIKNLSGTEYVKTALEGTADVSENILNKVDNSIVIAYTVPVKFKDSIVGALVATRASDFMTIDIKDISVGDKSYAFVISNSGVIQAHPNMEMVENQYNILEDSIENADMTGLHEILEKMVAGETGDGLYNFNGESKYMGYSPVKGTQFSIGVTIPEIEVMKSVKSLKTTLSTVTIILLIAGLIASWYTGSTITKPIVESSVHAQKLGSGDFSADISEVYIKRNDEIGKLAKSFSEMSQNFKVLISTVIGLAQQLAASSEELTAVTEQVSVSSGEISKSVEEIAQGATDQAKDTESGAVKASELGELIDIETNQLNSLSKTSEQINLAVEGGLKSVNILKEKSKETLSATETIASGISLTNESSKKIGEASNLISNIADQTNLLALNAAIEAARAGEHGKGFAVVAEEIRKLAEQSTDSTKVIDSMVNELVKNSQSSVDTMKILNQSIEDQLKSVYDTEIKYNDISTSVENSMELIRTITSNSEKMIINKDTIIEVMSGLAAIAEENAAGAEQSSATVHTQSNSIEEIAEASRNLAELAQQLTEASGKFKI